MQTRLGRTALHGALPTSAFGPFECEGVFFPRSRIASRAPLALLSPSFREEDQTGSAGCLVKGVRFPGPKCLPSPVATRIPLGPKPERNREAFTSVRRSRDEDRRARVNHPPFYRTAAELPRLRA